jgi:hypothetical protein
MFNIVLNTINKIASLKSLKEEDKKKIVQKICDSIEYEVFNKKLIAEINKIDFDKWHEGIKTKCDPGQDYITKWIKEHGRDFDEEFSKSDCQTCLKVYDHCTEVPQYRCKEYKPDLLKQTKHVIEKIFDILNEDIVLDEKTSKVIEDISKHYKI